MFSKQTYYCKFLFLVLFHHFRTRPKSVLSFYILYIPVWPVYQHDIPILVGLISPVFDTSKSKYYWFITVILVPYDSHEICILSFTDWEILVKSPMLEIISRQCRKPSGDSDTVCRESGQGEQLKTQWFQIFSLNNV